MSFRSFLSPRRIILLLIPAVLLTALFLFFRGPYVSKALKDIILPELIRATGKEVTAKEIYINIFPLFIEARDIEVSDSGTVIIKIPRIKGYIGIMGLLRKEIYIRRLLINKPDLKTNLTVLKDIIERVKEYLAIESKLPFKVKIRGITMGNGRFEVIHRDSILRLEGVGGDALITPVIEDTRINISVQDTELSSRNWPPIRGSLRSSLLLKKDSIDIKRLDLMINGSEVTSSGLLPIKRADGEIKARFSILMETLKRIFGLKNRGEGEIRAEGTLRLLKGLEEIKPDLLNSLFIDLDVKGSIYIESLLELVKVKEKIEGLVDFSGNLKGPLKRISGKGEATMRGGNLFGISVKTLRCQVGYSNGMLNFTEGKASLYNGTARAFASVQLYGGGFYSVDIKADEIDSRPLLDLIGWRPDIPPGKVRGEFRTAGNVFKPSGWFEYRALKTEPGDSEYILRRISSIKGLYTMEDDILTLHNASAETGLSELKVEGSIDIASSTLDLKAELLSQSITDISSPYLKDLSGSGRFYGTVKGKFDDPLISGHIEADSVSLYRHRLGHVSTDLDYRKRELAVRGLLSKEADREIKIRGSIAFGDAREIFDLKNPSYNLSVTVRNADIKGIVPFLRKESGDLLRGQIQGILDADLSVTGTFPELKGTMKIHRPAIKEFMFDSLSASFTIKEGETRLQDLMIKRLSEDRESIIRGEGIILRDETLQFNIKGMVSVKDLYRKADLPVRGILDFQASGKGRLRNPEIDITATLISGSIKRAAMGDCRIRASLRDKKLTFESLLFNDRAKMTGRLDTEDLSWSGRIELRSGRYDTIISGFLKDVPEDLLLNIRGHADLTGKGEHFTATGLIDEMNLTLYGYSFSSERDIRFSMKDWRISIPPVKIRSGATSFDLQGVIDINKEIDITMEGRSNLSPLKGFSKKIETIRGEAEFVLSISGRWDSPGINGGLSISNAFLGIKGIPHRLSNARGYLFIDEDRIVIDKVSGKIGGGDIEISGITYLKGFKIKKFYIDSIVNNISVNLSRDFPVNFNGNLLLRGTPESRLLSGEIRINRARYKERVEWKSWLLRAKTKERPKGEIGAIEDTGLNIKIYGTDDIVIDNNIARANVRLDMLLRGTVLQPIIFGRIESTGGNVYFRNNEFRIVKASADFSDPRRINPVMEIVAVTSVKGYNIRLNLEGQMEHFNLSLLSDPPLPEIDILSLLTVGKFGKELKGIESGIGAGEATSFLTGKMQDVIEERVRSLTGLDRLEVDPYVSRTTGTVSPRVTVSKRLLGDRLYVTYSSAVGTAENNVLRLEYILNRNVSLVGVRDEKGGIGGDIKFRFEFK